MRRLPGLDAAPSIRAAERAARGEIDFAEARITVSEHAAAARRIDIETAARKHLRVRAGLNLDAAVLTAQRFGMNVAAAGRVSAECPAPTADAELRAGRRDECNGVGTDVGRDEIRAAVRGEAVQARHGHMNIGVLG